MLQIPAVHPSKPEYEGSISDLLNFYMKPLNDPSPNITYTYKACPNNQFGSRCYIGSTLIPIPPVEPPLDPPPQALMLPAYPIALRCINPKKEKSQFDRQSPLSPQNSTAQWGDWEF